MGVNNLPRVVTQQRPVEDRTLDLLIASPTPYLFATTLSLECCIMMFINFYIARPTYCFILMYTCRLTFAIKRIRYVMFMLLRHLIGLTVLQNNQSASGDKFWGTPTGASPLDPAGGLPSPDPLQCTPLALPPKKNLKLKLRLC